jgi:hypothetical protein
MQKEMSEGWNIQFVHLYSVHLFTTEEILVMGMNAK